ncbi:NUDIX domain-containing protein [Cohnella sp. JJ-181]|uniref:NUDIX domain-containing protein n=1 Tax=Cohnella rhizoplanae TaxID=2974897 RepID=UPI0023308968|nr:NUDIX domain-containing protein [Cohnella sp. JJ-181]
MAHVRIRCTGLIIENGEVLLVEYDERGVHYNLPGGGLEPGETIVDGVAREVAEETCAEVEVGPLALVYEMAPHKQSGNYLDADTHSLHLIFDCKLKPGSRPRMPDRPDPNQTAIKWVRLDRLEDVLLIPNIAPQIRQYAANQAGIRFIEDDRLPPLPDNWYNERQLRGNGVNVVEKSDHAANRRASGRVQVRRLPGAVRQAGRSRGDA